MENQQQIYYENVANHESSNHCDHYFSCLRQRAAADYRQNCHHKWQDDCIILRQVSVACLKCGTDSGHDSGSGSELVKYRFAIEFLPLTSHFSAYVIVIAVVRLVICLIMLLLFLLAWKLFSECCSLTTGISICSSYLYKYVVVSEYLFSLLSAMKVIVVQLWRVRIRYFVYDSS